MARGEETYVPYLVLRVARARLVPDTLTGLLLHDEADFKKPLKVG